MLTGFVCLPTMSRADGKNTGGERTILAGSGLASLVMCWMTLRTAPTLSELRFLYLQNQEVRQNQWVLKAFFFFKPLTFSLMLQKLNLANRVVAVLSEGRAPGFARTLHGGSAGLTGLL